MAAEVVAAVRSASAESPFLGFPAFRGKTMSLKARMEVRTGQCPADGETILRRTGRRVDEELQATMFHTPDLRIQSCIPRPLRHPDKGRTGIGKPGVAQR